jgi:hypothetical protein
MIIDIFFTACLIFSVFIIVKQEQTIKQFKSNIKQHKFNSEQNFLFFQKAEEKNRILKTTIINHENLIINLQAELKNIKQLLSNN